MSIICIVSIAINMRYDHRRFCLSACVLTVPFYVGNLWRGPLVAFYLYSPTEYLLYPPVVGPGRVKTNLKNFVWRPVCKYHTKYVTAYAKILPNEMQHKPAKLAKRV